MRRVLFIYRGVAIYSYPAFLYLGIVLGLYAQMAAALSLGMDVWPPLAASLLLLITALFGARILFVAQHWPKYRTALRDIWRYTDGGAAMYGGLIAVPLSIPLLMAMSIPLPVFWDLASFTLLVGLIVTRVGCFLNGCCAGRASSSRLAVELPNYRGVRHRRIPLQIIEAVVAAIVLAGAVTLRRRMPFQGGLFLYTLGTYGAVRLVLESFREEQDRVRGISVHAVISVVLVGTSIVAFAAAW